MKLPLVIALMAISSLATYFGTSMWFEYRHDRAVAAIEEQRERIDEQIADLQQEMFIENCIFDMNGEIDHTGRRDARRIICYSTSEWDEAGRRAVIAVFEVDQ